MPRSSAQTEGPALGPRRQVEGQLMFPELPRNGPKRLVLGLGSGHGPRNHVALPLCSATGKPGAGRQAPLHLSDDLAWSTEVIAESVSQRGCAGRRREPAEGTHAAPGPRRPPHVAGWARFLRVLGPRRE